MGTPDPYSSGNVGTKVPIFTWHQYPLACVCLLPQQSQVSSTASRFDHVCLYHLFSTVTNFPEGRLTISALDCLEAMAGISICNQLAPVFCTMAAVLHMDHSTLNYLRTENNPVEGSKAMFEAWISGKSSLPPTWKMLLEKLHTIRLGELAQRVEHFFNVTPVISQITSPVGCTCIVIIVL